MKRHDYVAFDWILSENLSLASLTSAQLNLLMTFSLALKKLEVKNFDLSRSNSEEPGASSVTLSFSELRKKARYSSTSNASLIKDISALRSIRTLFYSVYSEYHDPYRDRYVNTELLNIDIDEKGSKVTVGVKDPRNRALFCPVLSDRFIDKSPVDFQRYTGFYLESFVNIHSVYIKRLFLFLLRYKKYPNAGFFVKRGDLYRFLGIHDKKFDASKVRRVILDPACKLLDASFHDLRFEEEKGERKVIGYRVYFSEFENLIINSR